MNHVYLAGYDLKLLNELELQMKCYFSNHIEYSVWDFNTQASLNDEAMIVVFSSVEYHYAINHYEGEGKIVLGKLTLTTNAYKKINGIQQGSSILFGHLSNELAQGYIQHLFAYDFPFEIEPCSIESINQEQNIILISETLNDFLPLEVENIIIFDSFLIDRSTLIHIGFSMNLDEIMYPQDLQNKYKATVSSNVVLSEIIDRNNRFRSELGIVSQIVDDAIVAVDINGMAHMYNDFAFKIFGTPIDSVIGNNVLDIFKVLQFDDVLKRNKTVKDNLIEVNGKDLIVTINPIYHSKKLSGAVAIIREFYEEEVKQHKFRKQIIDKGHKAKYRFDDLIGSGDTLRNLKIVAERMSKSNSSVLIYGESGTGKELIAQAMHFTSNRSKYQFVALNCGALPESLLESELFGYEEGSFTGARKGGKLGLFELAHQGTIFLDEIGEMPISTQLRLLRVLQEREVMRIGSDRLIKIDVRIIAATNKNLKKLVKSGEFREDLYYRLNVLPLKVPALRERKEDINELIMHFRSQSCGEFSFDDEAMEFLLSYHWPGNIRELRNYVEYWMNLDKESISKTDLPFLEDIQVEKENGYNVKDLDFEKYIEFTHQPLSVSSFILKALNVSKNNNKRIGRKALYDKSRDNGFMISEHEIRHILLQMETFGYVNILKGRGGTVITSQGINALTYFREKQKQHKKII